MNCGDITGDNRLVVAGNSEALVAGVVPVDCIRLAGVVELAGYRLEGIH